jgi:hypothetical protein
MVMIQAALRARQLLGSDVGANCGELENIVRIYPTPLSCPNTISDAPFHSSPSRLLKSFNIYQINDNSSIKSNGEMAELVMAPG